MQRANYNHKIVESSGNKSNQYIINLTDNQFINGEAGGNVRIIKEENSEITAGNKAKDQQFAISSKIENISHSVDNIVENVSLPANNVIVENITQPMKEKEILASRNVTKKTKIKVVPNITNMSAFDNVSSSIGLYNGTYASANQSLPTTVLYNNSMHLIP